MVAHSFNWHEESKKPGSMWDWATIVLQNPEGRRTQKKDDLFDELCKKTDDWKNVVVTVQMNGVEMDAQHFFERLIQDYDRQVAHAVAEKIEEADLDPLYDQLTDITKAVKVEVRRRFEAVGIRLPDEDGYYE